MPCEKNIDNSIQRKRTTRQAYNVGYNSIYESKLNKIEKGQGCDSKNDENEALLANDFDYTHDRLHTTLTSQEV